MPWVHLHVSQNGNVIPCCQAPPHKVHRFGNVNEQSISEIWKGEAIDTFRKKMLNGEKDHRCKQCYIKEEQGFKSLREKTNKTYPQEVASVLETGKSPSETPIYFDLRFSNACNLKCRICGPWASSQWYKDAVALGMREKESKALTIAINDEKTFFEELSPLLSSAKEFYFAGGEPLMMEQHYLVLQALIDCGNTDIQLAYNTNFSTLTFKDYKVIDFWKHFPNINISASLDAEGKQGEFLRKNINWDKVLENRKLCLEQLPHINFEIAPTVCVFNVSHIPSFHKSWVEKGFIQVEDFVPYILIHPKEYQINVLPLEEQIELKTRYQEHIIWVKNQQTKNKDKLKETLSQFESIIEKMGKESTSQVIQSFTEITQKLDELRKENTSEIFPELLTVK